MTKVSVSVILYISGIICSNLLLLEYEEKAVYWIAFLVIPIDLLTRDILHQSWLGRNLWLKMGALIFIGAAITIIINISAKVIVLASLLAFLGASVVNTYIYHKMLKTSLFARMTVSSVLSAIVDSVLFILIVFGFEWKIVLVQILVKSFGVYFWTYLYNQLKY